MQLSPRTYKVLTFAIAFSVILVVAELLVAQADTLRLPIWIYIAFSALVLGAVWFMMRHLLAQEAALRNSRANILAVFGAVTVEKELAEIGPLLNELVKDYQTDGAQ